MSDVEDYGFEYSDDEEEVRSDAGSEASQFT